MESLENRRFMDLVYNGAGKLCMVEYNLKNKQFELSPLQKESPLLNSYPLPYIPHLNSH